MLKIALLQIKVRDNKKENLEQTKAMVLEAVDKGARMIILPEMFNCPYDSQYFSSFAERAENGETINFLAELAAANDLWIIGGSIPEREGESIYNTSFTFNNKGQIVARHRKMHLYDVALANGFTFKESATLSAGKDFTIFDSPWGKVGVLICYDIRFPEPARILALRGAKMIVLPAAFNMTTGPAHWEPQMRIRALDNQVFIVASSPARNLEASYNAYGHSMVVSPWGEIIAEAGEQEAVLVVELDLRRADTIREEFPLLKHLRRDLYEVITK